MNKRQEAAVRRFGTVQIFLDRHEDTFATLNKGSARAEFDALVRDIARHAVTQAIAETRGEGLTAQLRVVRDDLRLIHLQPIAAVARSRVADTPAFSGLTLPHKSASDDTLDAAATRAVAILRDESSIFFEQCFAEDFVEQLEDAAATLRSVRADVRENRLELVHATREIAVLVKHGGALIRLFDALIPRLARGNRELVAGWRLASATKQALGRPRGERHAHTSTD